MWIKCPNGLDALVLHEDHIKRLLSEGGVEIPDPTLPSEQGTLEVSISTQEDTQPVVEDMASESEQAVVENEPVVRKRGRRSSNS